MDRLEDLRRVVSEGSPHTTVYSSHTLGLEHRDLIGYPIDYLSSTLGLVWPI